MVLPDPELVPWSEYFFQSFYHASILPLLLLTLIFAWFARPSTHEELPAGFRRFQWCYLAVWSFCVGADWLQGPYVYALYSAYGFSGREIAELFVAGFGASLAFGCIVGSVADRFGRKNTCLAYCVFYIVSCMTKHYKNYSILMFGRITGGIATSMLFSCFECWLVSEHLSKHRFSEGLLGYMFGLMFTTMYCVAIVAGLCAQFVADSFTFAPISSGSMIHVGGYCGPFDLSIICLLVGMGLIACLWEENYGEEGSAENASSMMQNIREAGSLLVTDKNMILLCLVVSCFEGAMFAFVFNWTPALESKSIPPPHGVIFALFMMACMIGASVATIIGDSVKPVMRLVATFAIGILCFTLLSNVGSEGYLITSFVAFLLFEFCVGLYFPSVGVLKSEIVPERIRGTMYNIYRIPLNAVVVALLLSHISMVQCFMLCGILLTVALVSVMSMWPSEKNEEACPLTKASKQV